MTLCDLATDFAETKSVTKSRLHCTIKNWSIMRYCGIQQVFWNAWFCNNLFFTKVQTSLSKCTLYFLVESFLFSSWLSRACLELFKSINSKAEEKEINKGLLRIIIRQRNNTDTNCEKLFQICEWQPSHRLLILVSTKLWNFPT